MKLLKFFVKKFGLLLNPMILSVQNIQTTLINAPDNVLGIVKGMSDIVLNDTKSTTTITNSTKSSQATSLMSSGSDGGSFSNHWRSGSQFKQNSYQNETSSLLMQTNHCSTSAKIQINEKDVSSIDRTLLNDDDMVWFWFVLFVVILPNFNHTCKLF